jgi:hypothetical protein
MANIGKIIISDTLLLQILDFNDGGIIRRVNAGRFGEIEIEIEHPDMPEVNKGDDTPIVKPIYTTYQDALGHRVTLRKRN